MVLSSRTRKVSEMAPTQPCSGSAELAPLGGSRIGFAKKAGPVCLAATLGGDPVVSADYSES